MKNNTNDEITNSHEFKIRVSNARDPAGLYFQLPKGLLFKSYYYIIMQQSTFFTSTSDTDVTDLMKHFPKAVA